MLKPILAASIEIVINKTLQLEPDLPVLLKNIQGNSLAISLTDWRLNLYFVPQKHGFKVFSQEQAIGSAVLTGKLIDILQLAINEPQPIFASGKVRLEGDPAILSAFQKFISQLHLDWEGILGKYLGLTIAHQLVNPIKRFSVWQKQNAKTTLLDLQEYIQEEMRLSPPREAVEDFYADLSQLKADVERLTKRIQSLRKNL